MFKVSEKTKEKKIMKYYCEKCKYQENINLRGNGHNPICSKCNGIMKEVYSISESIMISNIYKYINNMEPKEIFNLIDKYYSNWKIRLQYRNMLFLILKKQGYNLDILK